MNEPWLIYLLVFGAAVLAVEALYWLIYKSSKTQKSINRRLALSEKFVDRSKLLEAMRRERGFSDFNSPTLNKLNDLLVQTGLRISRFALFSWGVALSLFIFFIVAAVFRFHAIGLLLGFAGGVFLGPLLVITVLFFIRNRRISRFAVQLPDAIDTIVRGLRVGHPFSTSIELVSRELPDPIGSEFGITADEISFGQEVVTAVNNLSRRVGQEDLLFFVIAVSIQHQTGGNLADVLSRLSRLIRARFKLRLKVKALSAEGRMSGRFLSAMPFILFAVVSLMAPTYFNEVRASPILWPAVGFGFFMLILGNYIIYRMVNFKF